MSFYAPGTYPNAGVKLRAMGRKRKKRVDWKTKVHPAFIDIAKNYCELVEGIEKLKNEPNKAKFAELKDRALGRIVELSRRYRDWPEGIDRIHSLIHVTEPTAPIEEAVKQPTSAHFGALLEWLAWVRFGRPLWQLTQEDAAGNREASKMIERIIVEGNKLRYGEKVPGFKRDLDHNALMERGLPLGLDKLTAEELADCFDEVCSCGQEHTGDALKKQRKRLIKAIEAAESWQKDSAR